MSKSLPRRAAITYGPTYGALHLHNTVTEGNHNASVATDRGGGYVSVTNSTFKTAGSISSNLLHRGY